MKKIHALVMSLIMLFIVLAPAQNVEAAGKSLKVSEKAFFKEMKEFDYKGMNRYVKDWGEGGQLVSAFYMVPSGKKYFAKCASKMSYRIISTKKKGNKADVKVKFRYVNCEDFRFLRLLKPESRRGRNIGKPHSRPAGYKAGKWNY